MMVGKKFIFVVLGVLSPVVLGAVGQGIKSTDGHIHFQVSAPDGQLSYTVRWQERDVIEASPLGMMVDGKDLGEGVSVERIQNRRLVNRSYPTRGGHFKAQKHFRSGRVPVLHKASGMKYIVEVRVFDDGVAYRYVVDTWGPHEVSGEDSSFTLPDRCMIWYQTNTGSYEGIYEKHSIDDIPAETFMGPPVVVVLPEDGGYMAITEAALFDYSGMTLCPDKTHSRRLHAAFQDDKTWELVGEIKSPWRVIMISPDLDGLVNSDIIGNLNTPPSPDLARADWIRPGRGFWHWWSGKMGNWDSVAYDRQSRWVDYAAEFGFEYYLVDAGWEHTWKKPGKDKWALLSELCEYAKRKGVNIWVWKRWNTGRTEGIEMGGLDDADIRRDFFRRCKEAGTAGIKIDYMDSESKKVIEFYTDVLKDAADYHLMIDFHGANKPTGEFVTYPHEMTREGVRGLEYNKWSALPPSHYASLPFTRFLAGHGDFTPCTFNPEMLKGTTFALQLATAVCYDSPVMFYADKPELYLKTPAVDFMKAIPTVWDETKVLPGSKIGDLTIMARRTGTTWFVASINGGDRRSYELDLSFLGDGEFKTVLLTDDPKRPDNLIRTEKTLNAQSSLALKMNVGGGFVIMIKKSN